MKWVLPERAAEWKALGSLAGSGLAYTLSEMARQSGKLLVTIVPEPVMAFKLSQELQFFLKETDIPVLSFPDWETLPYDLFSPHQDIVSERLTVLCQLPFLQKGILIVPVGTLMHRLCPKEYLLQQVVFLKEGQSFQLETMKSHLLEAGYRLTSQVLEHGDFSQRGSLLDLFPMGSAVPIRIDLIDDQIDSIREFDVETQRSTEKKSKIQLLPAREFPLTAEAISMFRHSFREYFEGDPTRSALYLDVSQGIASPGLEYYLPFFFKKTSHLFEYFPSSTLIVEIEDILKPVENFWSEIENRYEQYKHDKSRPLLEPKKLFLPLDEFFHQIKNFPKVKLNQKPLEIKAGASNLPLSSLPSLLIESKQERPLKNLHEFMDKFEGRILFCVESAGRRELLKEILQRISCRPVEIEKLADFTDATLPYALIIAPLEEGFILENKLAFITEAELLGKRVMQRRLRKTRKNVLDHELQSLIELSEGMPVVHLEHGIGRYLGLTQLKLGTEESEYITLEYAGGDKLYIPVASIHLISRYSGADRETVPLHRLGSDQWQRAKRKAVEQVRDVAAELLEIYAHREAQKGYAHPKPDEHYEAFRADFPFEETADQQKAIEEVIQDLTSEQPMDRVICGDVGFGKTEVALRASFLVVMGGKQVAVLVPTTLLAEQHFQTFSDRFAGFPVKIEVISRFKNSKEQENICDKLKEGKVDIIIGTHKILQEQIKFKDLGLLIIDEEHRFGVRQKEAFKAMRTKVDVLTLTATPIPRTLNMAMSGIRDLSIIATPPARRLSVKTFVREKNSALIAEAVNRELYRGGQIYYLHNSVETIEQEAQYIQACVPTARVSIAHGQMRERELESVMSDFYHRRFNILVCTTIIETGIDIPTANTIIMDRADKLGLAQLHQLRGRVGRSHHQAYAYCLIPQKAKITPDAVKRLEAIAQLEELGSGFTLASQDLEIRGTGELLGEAQSGNIQSVGFNLYMDLLDQAIKTLKSGTSEDLMTSFKKGVEIDLHVQAFIPNTYISDVHTRLVLYKRISHLSNLEALQELSVEMIDRFGVLPLPVQNSFKVAELKLLAISGGIVKIEAGPTGGWLEFGSQPHIDPQKMIKLLQDPTQCYRLEGQHKLRFKLDLSDPKHRFERIFALLRHIVP